MELDEDTDLLRLFTGRRFSTETSGSLYGRFKEIETPFGGGFGNYGTVDSAFLEVWLIGGVIGVFSLTIILIYPIYYGWKNRIFLKGKLLFILGLLFTIASIGAPAITKNRISVTFFILLCMLIYLIHKERMQNSKLS